MNTKNCYPLDRVMIIDDSKIDRYLESIILKKYHFAKEILEFDEAKTALDFLIDKCNSPEVLPQLILLDIRMRDMDGFQFLENLVTLSPTLSQYCHIIMISSSLDPMDLERVEKNKVILKFIKKPLGKLNLAEIQFLVKSNFKMAK